MTFATIGHPGNLRNAPQAKGIEDRIELRVNNVLLANARELRPSVLDHLGLLPALEGLASDVAQWHGIEVDVKVTVADGSTPTSPHPTPQLILPRCLSSQLML